MSIHPSPSLSCFPEQGEYSHCNKGWDTQNQEQFHEQNFITPFSTCFVPVHLFSFLSNSQ